MAAWEFASDVLLATTACPAEASAKAGKTIIWPVSSL
jgi:hypothetical protein